MCLAIESYHNTTHSRWVNPLSLRRCPLGLQEQVEAVIYRVSAFYITLTATIPSRFWPLASYQHRPPAIVTEVNPIPLLGAAAMTGPRGGVRRLEGAEIPNSWSNLLTARTFYQLGPRWEHAYLGGRSGSGRSPGTMPRVSSALGIPTSPSGGFSAIC